MYIQEYFYTNTTSTVTVTVVIDISIDRTSVWKDSNDECATLTQAGYFGLNFKDIDLDYSYRLCLVLARHLHLACLEDR